MGLITVFRMGYRQIDTFPLPFVGKQRCCMSNYGQHFAKHVILILGGSLISDTREGRQKPDWLNKFHASGTGCLCAASHLEIHPTMYANHHNDLSCLSLLFYMGALKHAADCEKQKC